VVCTISIVWNWDQTSACGVLVPSTLTCELVREQEEQQQQQM
jgi:hypothetical protein